MLPFLPNVRGVEDATSGDCPSSKLSSDFGSDCSFIIIFRIGRGTGHFADDSSPSISSFSTLISSTFSLVPVNSVTDASSFLFAASTCLKDMFSASGLGQLLLNNILLTARFEALFNALVKDMTFGPSLVA